MENDQNDVNAHHLCICLSQEKKKDSCFVAEVVE